MAKQIRRFSPHQTAKVFAVLMALSVMPFIALMGLLASLGPTRLDANGNPVEFPLSLLFIFPVLYLVLGYISVTFGCWLYNVLYRFIGGIEIEVDGE